MDNSIFFGSLIAAIALAAPAGYLMRDIQLEEQDSHPQFIIKEYSYILPETFIIEYSLWDLFYTSSTDTHSNIAFINTYYDDDLFYYIRVSDDNRDENLRLAICWQMFLPTSGTLHYGMIFSNNQNYYSEYSDYNITTGYSDTSDRITLYADIIDANNCTFGIWNPILKQCEPIISNYVYREWGWTSSSITIDEMSFEPF